MVSNKAVYHRAVALLDKPTVNYTLYVLYFCALSGALIDTCCSEKFSVPLACLWGVYRKISNLILGQFTGVHTLHSSLYLSYLQQVLNFTDIFTDEDIVRDLKFYMTKINQVR